MFMRVTSSNMASRLPSPAQISKHVKELNAQEQVARLGLEQPEKKPGIHKQLRRLISRISREKAGLEKALLHISGQTKP